MRVGLTGFQPERLLEAREARGISQIGLSEVIGRNHLTISRWENGVQPPEADALRLLADALNLRESYFLRAQPDHGPAPMFFRSMASITQTTRKRSRARLRWAQDISLTLQESLDLPAVNLPRLDVKDFREISNEDIETIASECRRQWNLGKGPISDLMLAVENAGVVIVSEEVGAANMDGLSNWSMADNRPYIFTAKDKASCVRSRMDVAHELAHLILHNNINEKSLSSKIDFAEIERQAFYFAGAFLMPAESFGAEIWSPSLDTFLSLKKRWKTAIGAMIQRCAALNIISDDYKQQLWKYYSGKGWRKREPLDEELMIESPRLLGRSVKLLLDEGVKTAEQLMCDARFNSFDLESLCGLPRGFLSNQQGDVVPFPKLKIIRDDKSS